MRALFLKLHPKTFRRSNNARNMRIKYLRVIFEKYVTK